MQLINVQITCIAGGPGGVSISPDQLSPAHTNQCTVADPTNQCTVADPTNQRTVAMKAQTNMVIHARKC